MKHWLAKLDTLKVCTAVFTAAVLLVGTYAFVSNRDATNRNRDLIALQQRQLGFLCETIAILDELNVQEARINRDAMNDPELGPLRPYLQQRNTILTIAHVELSEARGCGDVE
jgi:hypothetical protein